ncbi:MAG: hypothetical protein QM640_17130 [Niabella sp.]
MVQYNAILEILISISLLVFIYLLACIFRNRHFNRHHPYRKYFIAGLSVKISGAVVISCIYLFYYGGGDTTNFFRHATIINSAFNESAVKWLNLLFRIPEDHTVGYYPYISALEWYHDTSSYFVSSVTAFISLLLGGTFMPTAIAFAVLSFTGVWALFRTFARAYPAYTRQVAIAILFIPSVVIWGSGIFKDTLCICALGWLVYYVFQIMAYKKYTIKNIMFLILSIYIVYLIKVYILIAFLPALLVWIIFVYTKNIPSRAAKLFINISVSVFICALTYFTLSYLGEAYLGRYSLNKISETAKITRGWISYASGDEGSSYDLGEIDNPGDMLLKLPQAINVTLFRPYIWEARKIFALVSALESLLFLILTIKVIFTVGLSTAWKTIAADPIIQFCLIFSLLFAYSVGISTYNFGALSRYKIPCLPFYGLAVLLIYYKNQPKGNYLLRVLKI